MSTEERAKLDRNHARLAKLTDRTRELLSEDFTLASEAQSQGDSYADRMARCFPPNTNHDSQPELF